MTPKSLMPAATSVSRPRLTNLDLLRLLLQLDAIVLFLLGLLLMIAPQQIQSVFQFKDLPPAVSYLIGFWGCGLATIALGYWIAATNPIRHIIWVQIGIVRGALECVLGLVYLVRGIVTWQQGGAGLIVAAFMTIAYLSLYPRERQVVRVGGENS